MRSKLLFILAIVCLVVLSEISYRLITLNLAEYPQSQSENPRAISKMSRCDYDWNETVLAERISVCLPPHVISVTTELPKKVQAFKNEGMSIQLVYGVNNTCEVHSSYGGERSNPLKNIQVAGKPGTYIIDGDSLTLCVPNIGDGHEFGLAARGQNLQIFKKIIDSIRFEI